MRMKYVLMTATLLTSMTGLGTVMAQTAAPGTVDDKASPTDDVTEVVVTGIRKSLSDAMGIKKAYAGVVDAIAAEDIGDFPQQNMAEALQRAPGVQIRRDFAGGVGNEVGLRGLPPEYTAVTINGQSAASDADTRTFNFNVLPAELFRTVKIFKSPVASQEEGGIGGLIELETVKPLDFGHKRGVATLEANHNDLTGETSPRATLVYGYNWGKRGGIVLGAAYKEFSAVSQSYDAVRWTRRNFDVNGDKVNDYTNVFLMDLPRYVHEQQDVARTSLTGSGQYRFNDQWDMQGDLFFVHNEKEQRRYTPIWDFAGGKGINAMVVRDGIVEAADFQSVKLRLENNDDFRDTDSLSGTFKVRYAGEQMKATLYLAGSQSDLDQEAFRYFADNTARAAYDIRGDDNYYTLTTPTSLTNPSAFVMTEARRNVAQVKDREFTAGTDLSYALTEHWLLDFGGKFRDRSKARQTFAQKLTLKNEPFAPLAQVLDGFMEDVDGAPHSFLVHDFDKAYDVYGSKINALGAEEINNAYEVTEKVGAAYGMATWRVGPWLANGGVRVVTTDLTSTGMEVNKTTKINTVRDFSSSYTDVLPSLSLRYEARPSLYLRAAAAKVMTRPNLADLAAYREIDESTRKISAKNPELDPFRATQYDIGLDWYFGKEALLSFGYFFKDVESFIATKTEAIDYNGQAYTVTRPVNGNNAEFSGVEFSYQQPFTFLPGAFRHLGMAANYTYTESTYREALADGTSTTYGLPNSSKNVYNLTAYYETTAYSLRLAYNYRDKFLREVPNLQDGLKWRDGYGQLDLSARYNLSKSLRLTFDVQNLTEAVQEEYVYDPRMTDGTFSTGRTFQLGLRARF